MVIKKQIENEIIKVYNKYSCSAEEIVSAFNREETLRKDYEGRQIFELLQNADDEAENIDGEVHIELNDTTLTVKNTGTPFSFSGIKSLMYPNASPKKINENKIGNKGLGFRAMLNWADSIKIITKEFCVEFSKEHARFFYEQIIQSNLDLISDIRKLTKHEFPISLLSCPKLIDEKLLPNEKYDTVIVFECKDNLISIIQEQIEALTLEELIFLKNLTIIHLKTGETYRTIEKVEIGGEVLLRETDEITKVESMRNWKIYKRCGEIETEENSNKMYEFIIAYNDEYTDRNNVLYSYFKTEISMPFPR